MHSDNWDDLRFVLAVADHGSVSGAARELGVNHATVLRRIAAFETRNGGPVFQRSPQGYALLPERTRVLDAARDVAQAVRSVERLMRGARAPISGVVRVSSTDSLCQIFLAPLASRLKTTAGGINLELLSSNAHLDFARLQADITVRPAVSLSGDLVGTKGGMLHFAAYATRDCVDGWLGLSGPLTRSSPALWMSENLLPEQINGASDSFMVLREMAERGMGRAVLPCFLGDRSDRLIRRKNEFPEISVPLWVASHAELYDTARIRTVRNYILDFLTENESVLCGTH